MLELNKIHLGDCLELMADIDDGSVDMILADLPYGATACHWDSIIPLAPLWAHYKRVIKPRGAIVLTGSQPFTSVLVMSNLAWFRYEWIWDKVVPGGMSYARFQPMRQHETALVFYKDNATYNPQKTVREKPIKEGGKNPSLSAPIAYFDPMGEKIYFDKFPTSIQSFMKIRQGSTHPTQKPIALFAYLIRTYTNHGEIILDNVIGSGTTAIAAIKTGRQWIGIEKDEEYFKLATKRVEDELKQLPLAIEEPGEPERTGFSGFQGKLI